MHVVFLKKKKKKNKQRQQKKQTKTKKKKGNESVVRQDDISPRSQRRDLGHPVGFEDADDCGDFYAHASCAAEVGTAFCAVSSLAC